MKHLLTAILLLGSSLLAFADGKIAVVDFEKAILNTDRVKEKYQELEADPDNMKKMEEAKAIQAEYKQLAERLQKEFPTMSIEEKQKADAQLKSKQADLEHIGRKIQDISLAAIKPIMSDMNRQAQIIVQEIISVEGIGLLLHKTPQAPLVIHADTSFDITAKVTDKLNKLNSKK